MLFLHFHDQSCHMWLKKSIPLVPRKQQIVVHVANFYIFLLMMWFCWLQHALGQFVQLIEDSRADPEHAEEIIYISSGMRTPQNPLVGTGKSCLWRGTEFGLLRWTCCHCERLQISRNKRMKGWILVLIFYNVFWVTTLNVKCFHLLLT